MVEMPSGLENVHSSASGIGRADSAWREALRVRLVWKSRVVVISGGGGLQKNTPTHLVGSAHQGNWKSPTEKIARLGTSGGGGERGQYLPGLLGVSLRARESPCRSP